MALASAWKDTGMTTGRVIPEKSSASSPASHRMKGMQSSSVFSGTGWRSGIGRAYARVDTSRHRAGA
jgi:hypothetical protein